MRTNVSLQKIHALIQEHCPTSDWKCYLDAFFFECQVKNLSDKTVRVYAERLLYLVRYLSDRDIDVNDVTKRILQEYIVSLQGTVSDATVNGRIRVFRCFWNYLCEDGIWESANPCHKIKLIREESKIRNVITPEQYASVLRRIDRGTFEGFRNYTMMMVMWDLYRFSLIWTRVSCS